MSNAQTVPALALGTVISGYRVIAAIREDDRPGYLPGCHVVAAVDTASGEHVTWQVAWQSYQDYQGPVSTPEGHPGGRWIANAGHHFRPAPHGVVSARSEALADMLRRAS
jgi:hypothetical protein